MCELMQKLLEEETAIVAEKAKAEGKIEGRAEGRYQNSLENLKALMSTMNLSATKAMDALRIPQEDRAKLMPLLQS